MWLIVKCDLSYLCLVNLLCILFHSSEIYLKEKAKRKDKAREAANNSTKANKRAKIDFYNSVKGTVSPRENF